MFSFLGVVEDVLAASTPPLLHARYGPDGHTVTRSVWCESADPSPGVPHVSTMHPCGATLHAKVQQSKPDLASISQAALEGVLRKHVLKLGGIIETGVELIGLEQFDTKVTARLKRWNDGEREGSVDCAFLLGADGAKGTSEALSIDCNCD